MTSDRSAAGPPRWHAAIAWALVGERLALPEPGRPDPTTLVTDLAAVGWTADRIGGHASSRLQREQAWPHPVPPDLRAGTGPAQLHAALAATRTLLGLATLETRPPSGRTRLDANEQRLLRDVPPHHGT